MQHDQMDFGTGHQWPSTTMKHQKRRKHENIHAQTAAEHEKTAASGFLSIYFALDLAVPFTTAHHRLGPTALLPAAALVLGGIFGTWLRVTLGRLAVKLIAGPSGW